MTPQIAIVLSLLLPVVACPIIALVGTRPNVRDTVSFIAGLLTFGTVLTLLPYVQSGVYPELSLFDVLPGVSLAFKVEPLGMLFGLVASGLWIVTGLYGVGYMRGHHEVDQTRFFFFFAFAITAALGVAFAGNLLTLFIFYEVLTLSTYPLVTHARTPEALRGGRIYLGILLSTSVAFLLLAVLWTYFAAGTRVRSTRRRSMCCSDCSPLAQARQH